MTTSLDPPQSLIEARDERRKTLRRRIIVSTLAAVALICGAVYLFGFAGVFTVDTIRVRGTDRLPPEQVRAILDDERGRELALLNTSSLAAEVEQLSAVSSAEVKIVWPSTLGVTVAERPSLGVVEIAGKSMSLDDTGERFTIDGVDPVGPRITVPGTGDPDRAVRSAAAVLVALPQDVRDAVVSVEAASADGVRLELSGERTVVWGNAAASDRKAAVLDVLLTQGGSWFDVSTPDAPLTREKPPARNS